VGAIYEQDKSADAWNAINDKERRTAAQISRTSCTELDNALGLPAGTVSPGKTVTALKRLGFDNVYDSQFAVDLAAAELGVELQNRVKNSDKKSLPIISACSHSAVKFIENFYPDLTPLLSPCRSPQEIFHSLMKKEKTTTVSIEPCISNKGKARTAGKPDMTLTVKELARMLRLAGINFASLEETPFDKAGNDGQEADFKASGIKSIVVNGLGKTRAILDSVRKGECDADLIEIRSCPSTDGHTHCVLTNS